MFGNAFFGPRYFGDRYFGGGSDAPPPEPPPSEGFVDLDGLRRRDRDAEEFEQSQRASREALRAAIERAFEGPQQPAPLDALDREQMARFVLDDIRLDGFNASLARIEQLIADYERQMIEEEEEEAAIALLLMH